MTLRAIWRPIKLGSVPCSLVLTRSSQNLAAAGNGNGFLLFGGELKPRTPVSAEVISVTDDSGVSVVPSPSPAGGEGEWPAARVGANLVRHPDGGSLLLWGGRGGKEMAPLAEEGLWQYDLATSRWRNLATSGDKPPMRSYGTAATAGGKLYIHAGCPASGRLGTLHALDLATLSWTQLPDAPGPARGGTVLAPLRGSGLLARWGGFCGHELGGPLDIFDPSNRTWSSHDAKIHGTNDQPPKRSVHALLPLHHDAHITLDGQTWHAVALLFMGEGEGAPKELGHDGAGKVMSHVPP